MMLAMVFVPLLRPVKMEKKGLEESFVNGDSDSLSSISLIVSRMHHVKKCTHCTMLLLSV
jgi:hypothetical protein